MTKPHIEVEGLRELQAAIKKQEGKLPASIGQAHKNVGLYVISMLPYADPRAVGSGAGAKVRPSATKREVLLLVGGSHREAVAEERGMDPHFMQWGKTQEQPFLVNERPYIVKTIEEEQEAIEQMFLDEVTDALAPAFYDAE